MPRFVVQEHQSRKLHYDFRLEMNGVLKSWAIPKGVPTKPGVRRLAVKTEDHDLSYINFEGVIPKGEYGAGTVKIWDRGEYEIESRKDYKIVFILHGKKLNGRYVLLRFGDVEKTEGKNWLIFKSKKK